MKASCTQGAFNTSPTSESGSLSTLAVSRGCVTINSKIMIAVRLRPQNLQRAMGVITYPTYHSTTGATVLVQARICFGSFIRTIHSLVIHIVSTCMEPRWMPATRPFALQSSLVHSYLRTRGLVHPSRYIYSGRMALRAIRQ